MGGMQGSAETVGNYQIDNGVSVSGASLGGDLVTLTLTTSALEVGVSYTLTVNNVTDRATTPNVILPDSTAQFTFVSALILQQNLDGYTGVTDTWMGYGAEAYQTYGGADYLRFYNPVELGYNYGRVGWDVVWDFEGRREITMSSTAFRQEIHRILDELPPEVLPELADLSGFDARRRI